MAIEVGRQADVEAARKYGKYWAGLRRSTDWIKRRVETTTIVDDAHIEVAVSLTLNIKELARRLDECGIEKRESAPIPLSALRKELQLDLDVRDEDGRPVAVAVSDEDSFYGHAFLLAELERLGIKIETLTERVLAQTYAIVRRPDGVDVFIEILDAIELFESGSNDDLVRLGISESDLPGWSEILANDDAVLLMFQVATGYFLVTDIPLGDQETSIIKFRRLASAELYKSRFGLMPLGLKPFSISLTANGIGTAQREHTRIIAPAGTKILDGEFIANGRATPIERRTDPRRIVFYTANYRPGQYSLRLLLRPLLPSFFLPAFICSLLMSFFMLCALLLELKDARFSPIPAVEGADASSGANVDATVALIVLLPTLFAVFLIQRGEHGLVSQLHSVPRAILLVESIIVVIAAGAVAVAMNHDTLLWMFWVATGTTVLGSAYFSAVLLLMAVRRLRRPVAAFAEAWDTSDD